MISGLVKSGRTTTSSEGLRIYLKKSVKYGSVDRAGLAYGESNNSGTKKVAIFLRRHLRQKYTILLKKMGYVKIEFQDL